MTKEKENAAIISQEEIAHGHVQYVDQNESGGNGRAGAVYLDVLQTTEANFFRARSVFAR